MSRAQRSNSELVGQLEPLRNPLMRFFMRRVENATDAEDLTQATFTRLLQAGNMHLVSDPQAFVFRTAINLLRDRARRQQTRNSADVLTVSSARISETSFEFVEDISPERVLSAKDRLAEVMAALDELKPRTRDIFLLVRLENMKHAAIAELFGISVSSVEKEVVRATRHLAKRFGERA